MLALLHPGCYACWLDTRRGTCRAIPTTRWRNAPGICPMYRRVPPTLDNSTRVDVISSILPKYLLDVVANLPANVDRGKGAGWFHGISSRCRTGPSKREPYPRGMLTGARTSRLLFFSKLPSRNGIAPPWLWVAVERRLAAPLTIPAKGAGGHLLTGSDGTEQCTTIVKRVGATRRRSIGP